MQGKIRVIGGRWRGRRLSVTRHGGNRPTPDRVRETLFNWLAPYIAGMECLDLFAGSGSLGVEALSRGAGGCLFIERDRDNGRQLMDTLRSLDDDSEVLVMDAYRFLSGTPRDFDLVFLDPPFDGTDMDNLCTLLERGWLKPGAFVYLELRRQANPPRLPAGWTIMREKTAGQVRFMLARR